MSYHLAVCVPEFGARSETFIRRHVQDLLPDQTVAIGDALQPPGVRDWTACGPLIDLSAISDRRRVSMLLRDYGVRVMLSEYLDASLEWIDLAATEGIRLYAHAHGYDVSMCLQSPGYARRYLRYNETAGVITMSEYSRRRLLDIGLSSEKIHVVPYGVDVPCEPPMRLPRAEVRLLAVGRMVAKKGPLLLLDAVRRSMEATRSIRLDYVGTGVLWPAAKQFVSAIGLGGAISLHGGLPNSLVQQLFETADIFVQHSITDPETGDQEGLPVAVLEAMAAGLPVVATRHAGIGEAVQDGVTGFLVPEGDTEGMSRKISQLADDVDLRKSMGKAAWQRAIDLFEWRRERQQLLQVMGFNDSGTRS